MLDEKDLAEGTGRPAASLAAGFAALALVTAIGLESAPTVAVAAPPENNQIEAAQTEPGTVKVTAGELEFFEREIRPLLAEHCWKCHSAEADEPRGGFRADSRAALLAGGDSGPAVVPGDPDASPLIQAVRYESFEMPPQGKLDESQIAAIERWVEQGAAWPEESAPTPAAGDPADEFDLQARAAEHWAWQPISDPAPPSVRDGNWGQSDLDAFLLARLEQAGLRPAPPASRRTLLRRLYFDLIGLPPTPAEAERFLSDDSDTALSRLVDRLLASPRFGERWGRHWLDLVRYAESRGHEHDNDAVGAYQYRDYTIRAFNADVPYDQLVREHLAGDLLPHPRRHPAAGFDESILGTGFWFLGEWAHSPVEIRKEETDRLDNMIDVMSKTFLGMTVSCARCHDHKFDAISTRDYYSLCGFLQSSDYRQVRFETLEHNRRVAEQLERLRTESDRQIRMHLAEACLSSDARIADYLRAARQVVAENAEPASEQAQRRAAFDAARQLADAHQLNAGRLGRWVDAVREAGSGGGPRLLAQVAQPEPNALAQRPNSAAATPSSTAAGAAAPLPPEHERVLVDYARLEPSRFIQNGFSFGQGPVRPGEVRIEVSPEAPPRVHLARYGAARRDTIWNGLEVVPDPVTNQRNRLRTFPRAGRTLRSPTFTVDSGTVSYLIEGAAHVVACVDSHRLVYGPLHGETILDVPAPAGASGPRWVTHRLERYRGHRIHVEFTTRGAEPLAVLQIIDGPPPSGTERRAAAAPARQPSDSADTAGAVEQRMRRAVVAWRDSEPAELAPRDLAIAAWMVDHLDLFAGPDSPSRAAVERAARRYEKRREELRGRIRLRSRTAMAMLDGTGEDDRVLIRGNHKNPGEPAPRRLLEALVGPEPLDPPIGSGRLQLADQINAVDNPLAARVIVNRLWQHLFGRGLVATPDNFGVLGQPPTHPELLDHLATRFLRQGRSIKEMIRYLVLSSAYQMSSRPDSSAVAADPKNDLWHHMPLRRLEGEVIRDSLLALGGRLDRKMYGPSVPIHLTPFMQGRGRPPESGPRDGDGRRSIYIAVRRNFLSPMMLAFDTPAPFSTMGRRNESNVPAQALILMNHPLVVEQARRWAERSLRAEPGDPQGRIEWLFQTAFARPPQPEERARAAEFLKARGALQPDVPAERGAWADLAHALINVKEFIYIR